MLPLILKTNCYWFKTNSVLMKVSFGCVCQCLCVSWEERVKGVSRKKFQWEQRIKQDQNIAPFSLPLLYHYYVWKSHVNSAVGDMDARKFFWKIWENLGKVWKSLCKIWAKVIKIWENLIRLGRSQRGLICLDSFIELSNRLEGLIPL